LEKNAPNIKRKTMNWNNLFAHKRINGGKGVLCNPGIPEKIGLKLPDTGKHDSNFPVTRNIFCPVAV